MNKIVNINTKFESYQRLINFYEANKNKSFESIHTEFWEWFGANMSATLGALLDLLKRNFNEIIFDYFDFPNNPSKSIELILLKNDFLTFYGKNREADVFHTTIKFKKLRPFDGKYFKSYVTDELLDRPELPAMSKSVKEKIVEAIYEMFVNAQIHSETEQIYTCGQSFFKTKTLEFTIVDTGIGIKNRVNTFLNRNLTASQAIQWAIKDKHTTKGEITGGIGLALLKEFIEKNGGKMQIISGNGFYEFGKEGEKVNEFSGEFPGTVVNLQFNTNDNCNYYLKNEIDINNIF